MPMDEIFKAIADYRSTHNLEETEAVVRTWYEKHDAILANAIEENRRIEQRDRDRQLGYRVNDAPPRSQHRQPRLLTRRIPGELDPLEPEPALLAPFCVWEQSAAWAPRLGRRHRWSRQAAAAAAPATPGLRM